MRNFKLLFLIAFLNTIACTSFAVLVSCEKDINEIKNNTIPDTIANITINPSVKKHFISPLIQGQGLIYSQDADSIYENGSMASLFRDIGTGFLRYPGGGVVTVWHWDDLNGWGWYDTWNPDYDTSLTKEPFQYMDLDEYITLVNATGAEPMLGINMSSGMEWNRRAESIQDVKDMINYCINQNFDVKYFFLDNENYHNGNSYNKDKDGDGERWNATSYANECNVYADAIKSLVPDAILIANWANNLRTTGTTNAIKTIMNIAGDNIDYIDIHRYWRWNDASWDKWKEKTPMEFENEWYDGGAYIDEINYFNSLAEETGKTHIKMASCEWNIGLEGDWVNDPSHTKFKTALMNSEIHLQHMIGGLELGALWAVQWEGKADNEDLYLVDPDDGYTPNPIAMVFEMSKDALGGQVVESICSDVNILQITVIKDNKLLVYALNKNDKDKTVEFQTTDFDILSVTKAYSFKDPGVFENIDFLKINSNYSANLPANALTLIEFE